MEIKSIHTQPVYHKLVDGKQVPDWDGPIGVEIFIHNMGRDMKIEGVLDRNLIQSLLTEIDWIVKKGLNHG